MSITLGQLAARFQNAASELPQATDQQLRTLGQVGVGYMKQEIQRVHAVDTGTMLNSVTMEVLPKAVLIGPTVKYAPYVALGTSRMAARPFHLYAAKRLQGAINQGDILREIGLK
ncbi:minor capsid protein [Microbacterium phage Nebulous]|nr:minor capsid protein [Microbacterium phage Nebulous]